MKHAWEPMPNTMEKVSKYGWSPVRVCKNCGVIQTKESSTAWMRVTGYSWQPLVGRCKPKEQTDE